METGTVVQLYNILQFFTWLTCQCFLQGMVFLSRSFIIIFIEMVFKSKFFLKFARVPILYCFEANDW